MSNQIWNPNSKNSRIIIWILRSIGFILTISLFIPLLSTIDKSYITYLGPFGDAINGITAPFIGVVVAILTFMAFMVQYEANENQRNDIRIERFENKYYEMIRLHRENVNEIEIEGIFKGREAIEKMYEEFKFMYKELEKVSVQIFNPSKSWLASITYYHFFKGVNNYSTYISFIESEVESEKKFINNLREIQDEFSTHKRVINKRDKSIFDLPFIWNYKEPNEIIFVYKPFVGYASKLGHYFRHLYQTLKLAATENTLKNSDMIKEFQLRYEYIKLMRVQLSNTEQSMIYFNSFFGSGLVWWEDRSQ